MPKFTCIMKFTPSDTNTYYGTIEMRCTHIDEELRGKGKIHSHDGIVVSSRDIPAMTGVTVFLRGTGTDCDNRIVTIPGTRTLYARYIAALLAAGGEVIEEKEEPVSVPEAVEPVRVMTMPAEERREYCVRIMAMPDKKDDIDLTVHLTRAELADLTADLIRRG